MRKRDENEKTPYLIQPKDGGPMAFAGLWSTWRPADGDEIISYTIMTTEPNEFMAKIHNRMPVILSIDDHDRWLDLDTDPTEILKPSPPDSLKAHPVDKRGGNVKNNDPRLLEAV